MTKRLLALLSLVVLASCAPSNDPTTAERVAPVVVTHKLIPYGIDHDYYLSPKRPVAGVELGIDALDAYPEILYVSGLQAGTRVECVQIANAGQLENELIRTLKCRVGDLAAGQELNVLIGGKDVSVRPYFYVDGEYSTLETLFTEPQDLE